VSLVSYQISGAFPASDRSQRLLGRNQECGEGMWTSCKELKGSQSLNERDPLPCGEIIRLNLRHIPLRHGCVETLAPQWSRLRQGPPARCLELANGAVLANLRRAHNKIALGRKARHIPASSQTFISCAVLVNCCVRRLEHSSCMHEWGDGRQPTKRI
jgi:hypothetical protein